MMLRLGGRQVDPHPGELGLLAIFAISIIVGALMTFHVFQDIACDKENATDLAYYNLCAKPGK